MNVWELIPGGTDNTYLAKYMVVFEVQRVYFMDGSSGEGCVLNAFAQAAGMCEVLGFWVEVPIE